jgi:PAS domain-containing protein
MSGVLRRLLQTHQFIDRALQMHGNQLAHQDREQLRKERDGIMLDLIKHKSSEPQVTLAQFRILLSSLVEMCEDKQLAAELGRTGLETAERLVRQSNRIRTMAAGAATPQRQSTGGSRMRKARSATTTTLNVSTANLLDSMQDRVAVYDRDYRYVFTNRANADFYGENAQDFIGRPSWEQVGSTVFERLGKPHIDMCFSGRSLTHITRLETPDKMVNYHITYDPLRDDRGTIVSALVIARDITHLDVPSDYVWTQNPR